MKRISIILIALLTIPLFAQNIVGAWYNSQYNTTMVLHSNGAYDFNGPYDRTSGSWAVQGQIFYMQDPTGQVVQYTITHFSNSQLNFMDAFGVPINYIRSDQQSQTTTQSTILSEKDGYSLTTDHIQTGVGIIEFIIGQKIKPSETDELTQTSIQEFNTSPKLFITEINSLAQSLQTLKSLQDAIQIGAVRQALVTEFHKATQDIAETDKPLLIQVINRYIKVMAYDPVNGLTLTDKDADAMIAYMEFSNRVAGVSRKFTLQEKQQFYSEIIQQFQTMGLEQKQFLCSSSLAWDLVQKNWQKMNNMQQQQIQQSYSNACVDQYAKQAPVQNSGESTSEAIARMSRENMAQQNMFNMMNNMSLQNHATMLNSIENFGGTGNYWEVTNSGY